MGFFSDFSFNPHPARLYPRLSPRFKDTLVQQKLDEVEERLRHSAAESASRRQRETKEAQEKRLKQLVLEELCAFEQVVGLRFGATFWARMALSIVKGFKRLRILCVHFWFKDLSSVRLNLTIR